MLYYFKIIGGARGRQRYPTGKKEVQYWQPKEKIESPAPVSAPVSAPVLQAPSGLRGKWAVPPNINPGIPAPVQVPAPVVITKPETNAARKIIESKKFGDPKYDELFKDKVLYKWETVTRQIFEDNFLDQTENKFPEIKADEIPNIPALRDWFKVSSGNSGMDLDGFNSAYNVAFEYNGPLHYSQRENNPSKFAQILEKDIHKKKIYDQKFPNSPLIIIPYTVKAEELVDYVRSRLWDIKKLKPNINPWTSSEPVPAPKSEAEYRPVVSYFRYIPERIPEVKASESDWAEVDRLAKLAYKRRN